MFEQCERGRGEDAVAERAQANNTNPGAVRKLLQDGHESLWLDSCLIDEHYGNIVAYGIDAVTLDAFEAASILFEDYFCFADGADEDFQQLLADWHGKSQFISGRARREEVSGGG